VRKQGIILIKGDHKSALEILSGYYPATTVKISENARDPKKLSLEIISSMGRRT